MKTMLELLKTMLLGGLFALLPLLLLYLMISEAVELVIVLATPMADLFPAGTFDAIRSPVLLALLLLGAVSLVLGLAMRSDAVRRLGHAVERTTLDRLPLYRALANLMRGFAPGSDHRAFRAAVLTSPDDVRELVYVVEDAGTSSVTVLRPHAPVGFVGTIGIVPRDRLRMLDGTIGDVTRVLGQWGVGAQALLPPDPRPPDPPTPPPPSARPHPPD